MQRPVVHAAAIPRRRPRSCRRTGDCIAVASDGTRRGEPGALRVNTLTDFTRPATFKARDGFKFVGRSGTALDHAIELESWLQESLVDQVIAACSLGAADLDNLHTVLSHRIVVAVALSLVDDDLTFQPIEIRKTIHKFWIIPGDANGSR